MPKLQLRGEVALYDWKRRIGTTHSGDGEFSERTRRQIQFRVCFKVHGAQCSAKYAAPFSIGPIIQMPYRWLQIPSPLWNSSYL